jgi:hypothetical protein
MISNDYDYHVRFRKTTLIGNRRLDTRALKRIR